MIYGTRASRIATFLSQVLLVIIATNTVHRAFQFLEDTFIYFGYQFFLSEEKQ